MLALRFQCIFNFARNMAKVNTPKVLPATKTAPALNKQQTVQVVKPTNKRFHTSGPELQITKILIKNGPLTSKQIWRSYQLSAEYKQSRRQVIAPIFKSLHKLKQTLRYMRFNGKIKNGGYDTRKRLFKGWLIQQQIALKHAHRDVILQLEEYKRKRNQL